MARLTTKPHITIPILAACSLAFIAFLSLSRDVPRHSLWQGWRTLACPATVSEAAITEALEASGIRDFASMANSRVSNPKNETLPESFLSTVNAQRQKWFEHEGTRYLYLRERSDLDRKVSQALAPLGAVWFLDGRGGFYPLFAILSLVSWSAMMALTRNRAIGRVALIPAILLPYSVHRWQGFAAALAIVLASFLAGEYFPRTALQGDPRKSLRKMRKAAYLLVPLSALVLFLFLVPPVSALRIIFSAALCPLLFALQAEVGSIAARWIDSKRAHPRFTPVKMAESAAVPRAATVLKALGLAIVIFAAGFAGQNFAIHESIKPSGELSLPAPRRYTGPSGFGAEAFDTFMSLRDKDGLPDLGDFLAVRWSVDTFPWRRLKDPWNIPYRGAVARYTEYRIDSEGKIAGTPKTMLTFDSAYVRHALAAASTPLERMLQDQGRFVSAKMTRMSR